MHGHTMHGHGHVHGHHKHILEIKESLLIKQDRPALNKIISSDKLFKSKKVYSLNVIDLF